MSQAERVQKAILDAGVNGVIGVRIGSDDRTTWTVFFDDTATAADVTAAQDVIDTVDPDSDDLVNAQKHKRLDDPLVDSVWRELLKEMRALGVRLSDAGVPTDLAFRVNLRRRFREHPKSVA